MSLLTRCFRCSSSSPRRSTSWSTTTLCSRRRARLRLRLLRRVWEGRFVFCIRIWREWISRSPIGFWIGLRII
ncbi:cap binding protein [Histoplasma ohiense]|nr:cap binding protein [Histoplasma ohiense (nom. inval.)]